MTEKRPGEYTEELKTALGMQEGGPPPWLINMQRYGPPPSFPNLKVHTSASMRGRVRKGSHWGDRKRMNAPNIGVVLYWCSMCQV